MFAAAGEEPAFPDDAVEVGRVIGAWGLKGGIKVKPFSADPQALFSTKRWFLQPPAPAAGPLLLRIASAREHGGNVLATAQDLADRDAAEALRGARIFVSRASFPTPGADEFYWVDLIGLAVHDRAGVELGTVVGLVETGPTCVLRVRPPAGAAPAPQQAPSAEYLIPFVSAYVDRVDLAGRCVYVDWRPDY